MCTSAQCCLPEASGERECCRAPGSDGTSCACGSQKQVLEPLPCLPDKKAKTKHKDGTPIPMKAGIRLAATLVRRKQARVGANIRHNLRQLEWDKKGHLHGRVSEKAVNIHVAWLFAEVKEPRALVCYGKMQVDSVVP